MSDVMAVDAFGFRHGALRAAVAPAHMQAHAPVQLRLRPAVVTVAALMVVVAALTTRFVVQDVTDLSTVADESRVAPQGHADAYSDLQGRRPDAFPASRLAIGFLALDDPLARAVEVFGPPDTSMPDINGQARVWEVAGAEMTVSSWGDKATISGVHLDVPASSNARFGIYGGAVIGESTLREVVAAWGRDYAATTSSFDDFVVRYIECVGPYPVVIKFDQAGAPSQHRGLAADSPRWDRPVTTMLVAYADEARGTGGCSS